MKKLVAIVSINLVIVLLYTSVYYSVFYNPIASFGVTVIHAFLNLVIAMIFLTQDKKEYYIPFFISIGVVLIVGLTACGTVLS